MLTKFGATSHTSGGIQVRNEIHYIVSEWNPTSTSGLLAFALNHYPCYFYLRHT